MARPVAFVFPGQGSQRVGMLDALPPVPWLTEALEAAEAFSGLPLRSIAHDGPAEALADTRVAQPLLFLADLAWAHALADGGVAPRAAAGHSLGELAALSFAGVLSRESGVELVCARGRIMAEAASAVPGGMAAVLGLERTMVSSLVGDIDGVWVANDNSASQAVISGTHAGLERAMQALTEAGARRVVPLDVAGAFHSPLMQSARDTFADILAGVEFGDARIPVVQNTEPSPATDAVTLKARLADQITAPVRWTETMDALLTAGIEVIVESGPGGVLTGLARRMEGITALAVESDGVKRVGEVVA